MKRTLNFLILITLVTVMTSCTEEELAPTTSFEVRIVNEGNLEFTAVLADFENGQLETPLLLNRDSTDAVTLNTHFIAKSIRVTVEGQEQEVRPYDYFVLWEKPEEGRLYTYYMRLDAEGKLIFRIE
ncbi:MAG: hypothetical protein WBA74_20980 [Cyclobacteriaceae bacterium]